MKIFKTAIFHHKLTKLFINTIINKMAVELGQRLGVADDPAILEQFEGLTSEYQGKPIEQYLTAVFENASQLAPQQRIKLIKLTVDYLAAIYEAHPTGESHRGILLGLHST